MKTYDIKCSGPFHEELRGTKGHTDVLAKVTLPDNADPKRAMSGYLCEACAFAARESGELFPENA